jgi:hypothetical protein
MLLNNSPGYFVFFIDGNVLELPALQSGDLFIAYLNEDELRELVIKRNMELKQSNSVH